jgi:dienelactone hydrolase
MKLFEQNATTRRAFLSQAAAMTGGLTMGLNAAAAAGAQTAGAQASTATANAGAMGPMAAYAGPAGGQTASALTAEEFAKYQQRRREDLWGLLGDLPWQHEPAPPQVIRREDHGTYTLERLVLDLNGVEPVPALLLIPKKIKRPAPGLLFIHWHAGQYWLGKEQLLKGTEVQPAYAPVLAEMGIVTLAIDSWCFGERQHDPDGNRGEQDAFKLMLWRGQVLYGMMMFDEYRAFQYLASRPEVDPQRLGATGMSMGSTKAWWLAALEPRVRLTVDICCLTDFDALIAAHGLYHHGVYYFVPSLLKEFNTTGINELIVPRPRLSVNGRKDLLTPPAGVEKVRDNLMPLYRKFGREEDCHIELFDCAHQELPVMRSLIIEWLRKDMVSA